jgi:hypothetical protein
LDQIYTMATLETKLKSLKPQEKRALADWLWRSADRAPALSGGQIDLLNSRAEAAMKDSAKRYPLGDAEKKLRR